MISEVFKIIWNICILRAAPQQLPASQLFMRLLLLLHFLLGVSFYAVEDSLLEQQQKTAILVWLLAPALELLLLYGFIQTVLIIKNFSHRLLQTVTATVGCNLVFGLMQFLILLFYSISGGQLGLISIVLLVIFVWSMTVMMHILKHALSISSLPALGLVLLYTSISLISLNAVFSLVRE